MFKRFVFIAACLLVASVASAQQWYTANSHTVAWDAGDGAVSYKLYLKQLGGTPILIGEAQATQAVFVLPAVGRYYPCVQSVAGEDVSEIVCSDVAANCLNNNTFGIKMNPGNPHNLR